MPPPSNGLTLVLSLCVQQSGADDRIAGLSLIGMVFAFMAIDVIVVSRALFIFFFLASSNPLCNIIRISTVFSYSTAVANRAFRVLKGPSCWDVLDICFLLRTLPV